MGACFIVNRRVHIESSVSGLDVTQETQIFDQEVIDVANIKSAKKRILVSERNAEKNKAIKSSVKTAIKKVYAAIEAGDKAAADTALVNATKAIDMATTKGVYKKNTSSRKVSRMAKAVNKMA